MGVSTALYVLVHCADAPSLPLPLPRSAPASSASSSTTTTSRGATEAGRYAVALLVQDKDSDEPGALRHIWLDTALKIPTEWLRTADTQQRLSAADRAAVEGRTIAIDMKTHRDCRGSTIVRLRMVGDVLTAGRGA